LIKPNSKLAKQWSFTGRQETSERIRFSWPVARVSRTIGTAATDDIPFVRSRGANTVIDFRTQRFEEEVRAASLTVRLIRNAHLPCLS
jgi:hypothetical protein